MIAADKCNAILLLHREGMGLRDICRRLQVGRNTVRRIIRRQGKAVPPPRPRLELDEELLRTLYTLCNGRAQRMHEKLTEELGVEVTYPTLTRRLRELGISSPPPRRCDQVPDEPGAEMQHDTTSYTVTLDGKPVRLVASVLYLRYSKRRYLKFYRRFERFTMKCFLHESLTCWGHGARVCIIDNTNLARLHGTGAAAVIAPEMAHFAQSHGFRFVCHELGHPNRKAGEERSFWTVETNFLPGREFRNLEDLNAQAFEWATVRMEQRPQGKGRIVPAKMFEHECHYLAELPAHLPAPYRAHERATDQYGYVAFEGNYYWVPGTRRDTIQVLQYAGRIQLYRARECLIEYPLPPDGVRNAKFAPSGQPQPRHQPSNRRHPTQEEEKRLRAMDERAGRYLDFALSPKGIQRHHFLRRLYALSRQMSADLFNRTLERALHYRITDLDTLRRIAALLMNASETPWPALDFDPAFDQRPGYQEGRLTDAPDFSKYNQILEEPHDE